VFSASIRWRRLAWLLLLLPLVALGVLARPQPPPNIVLILVDTLRAARLGVYGNPRGLTPFLDRLASSGTLFRNAYSTSSWTSPAVASLFTSRYPSQHRMANYESTFAADEIRLATRLQQAGYTTAAFVANSQISQPRGFAEGFAYWWNNKSEHVPAADVRRAVTAWLDGAGGRQGTPFCTFICWTRTLHTAGAVPSRFERGSRRNAGKADAVKRMRWDPDGRRGRAADNTTMEVASVDDEDPVTHRRPGTARTPRAAVVVVTADPEEFMEHGGMNHGRTLNGEVIIVPLIMVAAGRLEGRTVRANVSLVDIAPTLLELAGGGAEPRFEGRSLVPLLAEKPRSAVGGAVSGAASARVAEPSATDDASQQRAIIVELLSNGSNFDLRQHARAIIQGSTKLLVSPSGRAEVFALEEDHTICISSGGAGVPE
jgi:membrane-anchored protein YejM (alkaline phosphatase superfamily)